MAGRSADRSCTEKRTFKGVAHWDEVSVSDESPGPSKGPTEQDLPALQRKRKRSANILLTGVLDTECMCPWRTAGTKSRQPAEATTGCSRGQQF